MHRMSLGYFQKMLKDFNISVDKKVVQSEFNKFSSSNRDLDLSGFSKTVNGIAIEMNKKQIKKLESELETISQKKSKLKPMPDAEQFETEEKEKELQNLLSQSQFQIVERLYKAMDLDNRKKYRQKMVGFLPSPKLDTPNQLKISQVFTSSLSKTLDPSDPNFSFEDFLQAGLNEPTIIGKYKSIPSKIKIMKEGNRVGFKGEACSQNPINVLEKGNCSKFKHRKSISKRLSLKNVFEGINQQKFVKSLEHLVKDLPLKPKEKNVKKKLKNLSLIHI
eukprot:TRINITY_DN4135_c0_g1_i2.p2 TRINITY_DN4135_c0_g1~~TRINITY_DN4135_c0_g1_i2.p2  ORF type:complete len:277 (+),score=65.24 TRINITY_DN4135_c0_g1_i2:880-1710(+)